MLLLGSRARPTWSLPVSICALATINFTCAHPATSAATPASPPAPASPAVVAGDATVAPLPTRVKAIPTTEHDELRALGKTIARHVEHGFETLVVSTGEHLRCEGERLDAGAEVRVQGASDPRRPWSAWFPSVPTGADAGGGGDASAGVLVIRRPLPARGEHQIAHVYLPQACSGAPEHFRFALPDAEPQANDPRALQVWADGFVHHVGGIGAWGEFAAARLRDLYTQPTAKAIAEPADPRDAGHGKKGTAAVAKGKGDGKKREMGKDKGKPAAAKSAGGTARPAARVTVPRRDPSELARLMDTTTGMTSLQETLQTERTLLAAGDEPATIALAELKPPSFTPHPWAAMMAALGRPTPPEPLAAAAPASFYYVRFRSIAYLIQLRERLDAGLGPALAGMGEGADYDLAGRYEAELGLRQGPLTKLLGPTVVDDLAVVGSDPYLREGSDLSLIFRVRAHPAFEAALAGTLAAFGAAHGGLRSITTDHQGTLITITRSGDGVVRRHRAAVGGFDIVSNSLAATKRVIDAVVGREPRLADELDFRYMLARDAATPADVLAFLSDKFVGEVIGPRQKVLQARREIALAELSRSGFAALLFGWMYGRVPASADELVASGLLKRDELAHGGGERIDWQPGQAARSSWGAVGELMPLIDLPAPTKVTASEKAAYDIFITGYQSFWRTSIDPVAIRLTLAPDGRGPLAADVRVLPLISGTEYADMLRTVGHARIEIGPGAGGIRTAIGIGADAEIRHLLTRSLREMPMVGALKIDWLGDWALLGMDDTATPASREAMRKEVITGASDRSLRDLVELPIYAGVEVRNMTAAVAFLTGARGIVEQAAPGTIQWGEAGRERDVPFVAVHAGSAIGTETKDVTLYYAFCKSALVLSLSESALRHRIDDCVEGRQPRARSAAGPEGPQWILDVDVRERGPLWWRLALMAASNQSVSAARWSAGAAEAVLRGAPGASPSVVRVLARDTLGAIPVTPEGSAYALADDGVRDPLRGVRGRDDRAGIADLLASDASPFVRLGRLIAHARSEVAFDDEPGTGQAAGHTGRAGAVGAQPARSLHVKLRLDGDRR